MKKRLLTALLAISFIITVVFGITACNNADKQADEPPKEENPAPPESGEKGEQSPVGNFYTLQEAYNKGWFTQADLMNIAYYHYSALNWGAEYIPEGYNPAPKTPEVLGSETLTAIKQTYWDNNYKVNNPHNVSPDDIFIGGDYYGTYNGCVAVTVWLKNGGYPDVMADYYVGNVRFVYPCPNVISIWVASETRPAVVNVLPVLDEAKASEIRTAYYEKEKERFTGEYYNYTADDISFTYYGEYNGSYVMFIDTPFYAYTTAIRRVEIDGVPFVYASGQSLGVYSNGNFYWLNERFENSLFTRDDLLMISYKKDNGLYTKA